MATRIAEKLKADVYFDFHCPFVWNARQWLDMVKEANGGEAPVEITWKPLSLSQINQKVGPDYKVWDEPDDKLPSGVWALRACVAAQQQGQEAFDRFMPLLLKVRHVDRKELNDPDLLTSVAEEAGLDGEKFKKALLDRSSLDEVRRSHEEGVSKVGAFGTPTFLFPNGASAFLKMMKPDTSDEALRAYEALIAIMEGEKYIGEVKRPQPPWPKGVFA
ncbi:MAG: hypothetical protein FJ318_00080 [SAR202 cluster bacterium]|nr:hypothetical protein [SAR202 cluster bacterium]